MRFCSTEKTTNFVGTDVLGGPSHGKNLTRLPYGEGKCKMQSAECRMKRREQAPALHLSRLPCGQPPLACGLGHARGLTRHRRVIQDPRAASLPQRGGLTAICPRNHNSVCVLNNLRATDRPYERNLNSALCILHSAFPPPLRRKIKFLTPPFSSLDTHSACSPSAL